MSCRPTKRTLRTAGRLALLSLVMFELSSAPLALADAPELSGSMSAEFRYFPEQGQWEGQTTARQPSLVIEPEFDWRSGAWDLSIAPFVRLDDMDEERTHFDLREAYLRWSGEQISVRVGLTKTFWGVTESRHLVDVMNQWDALEDIDRENKLGQPDIEMTYSASWGDFAFHYLPVFREQKFPGSNGRFRLPLEIDTDHSLVDGKTDKMITNDLAVRYTHYFGNWDIGLALFHGIDRQPRLLPVATPTTLVPVYDRISQAGADLQLTSGSLLLKLEAIARDTPYGSYGASVIGLEYTFYQLLGTSSDLGILLEFQYDGRSEDPALAPPILENNDLFLGLRYAQNDTADSVVLYGVARELDHGSMYSLLEATRRIGPRWTIDLEGRFIHHADKSDLLFFFENDSNVTLRLNRYF